MSTDKLYHFPHEVDGFTLPQFGTSELVNYTCNLTLPDNVNVYEKASINMPKCDVDKLSSIMTTPDTMKATTQLVFLRLINRICDHCGYKADIKKLSICTDCCLVWYCNEECMNAHAHKHSERCCKLDGPLDKGYQALSFVKDNKH